MPEDDLERARARMKDLLAEALAIERLPPPSAAEQDAAQGLSALQERETRIAQLEHELLQQSARYESERAAWERLKSDLLAAIGKLKASCAAAEEAQSSQTRAWQQRMKELIASWDPHVLKEKSVLEELLREAREELGARLLELAGSEKELVKLKDLLRTAQSRCAEMESTLEDKQRQLQGLEAARRKAEDRLQGCAEQAQELERVKAALAAERRRVEELGRVLREHLKAERERVEEASPAAAALESWLAERPAFVRAIEQLRARVLAERQRWSKAYAAAQERLRQERERAEEASAARDREKKAAETERKRAEDLGLALSKAEASLREKAAMEAEVEPRLREKAALEAEVSALRAEAARQKEERERERDALQARLREAAERREEASRALAAESAVRKQAEAKLERALAEAESWLAEKTSMSYGFRELKSQAAAERKHIEDVIAALQGRLETERKRLREVSEAWEREGKSRALVEEKLDRALAQAETRLRERSAAAREADAAKAKLDAAAKTFSQTVRTLREQLEAERGRLAEASASLEAESKARAAAEQDLQRALADAQSRSREKSALAQELVGLQSRFEAERARREQDLRSVERDAAAGRLAEKKLERALADAESLQRENAAMAKELEGLRASLEAEKRRRAGPSP